MGAGEIPDGTPTKAVAQPGLRGLTGLPRTASGRAAHGSMPDQGRNAISGMTRIIERLQGYRPGHRLHPLLGPPTVSLGTIEGGTKVNVVADRCVLAADLRSVPGMNPADVLREVRALAADAATEAGLTAEVRVIADRPPVDTPALEPLVGTALEVAGRVLGGSPEPRGVSYFSDASVLTPALGVPTLIFGPGDERLAHQMDEHTRPGKSRRRCWRSRAGLAPPGPEIRVFAAFSEPWGRGVVRGLPDGRLLMGFQGADAQGAPNLTATGFHGHCPRLFALRRGVICVYRDMAEGRPGIGFGASWDGGGSWHFQGMLYNSPGLYEGWGSAWGNPGVVRLADGQLLCVCHTYCVDGDCEIRAVRLREEE